MQLPYNVQSNVRIEEFKKIKKSNLNLFYFFSFFIYSFFFIVKA